MFKNMYYKQIKNIEIKYIIYKNCNGAFSHDVTAAILVFQNNETAAMLWYRANPVGVLTSFFCKGFCSNKFA